MYPDYFYYEETISASGFQKETTSQFDIQRLLQTQPDFWISPVHKTQKKPKNIVFPRFLIMELSFELRAFFIQLIEKMIDDGFSVYCSSSNSSFFKFQRDRIVHQIDMFSVLTFFNDLMDSSASRLPKYDVTNLSEIYFLFEKLLRLDTVIEWDDCYKASKTNREYNFVINRELKISPELVEKIRREGQQGLLKEIIHRIEYLRFSKTIPEEFFCADLSNLKDLYLEEIHIDSALAAFLKKLSMKNLTLEVCRIDTLDFLSPDVIHLSINEKDNFGLSPSHQRELFDHIENIKCLKLFLQSPDYTLVHDLVGFYPNLIKLDTNLNLPAVLSHFPNLIELVFSETNSQKMIFEAGLSAETFPQLKVIKNLNYPIPEQLFLAMTSEEDQGFFDLCSAFSNIPKKMKLSSHFLEKLSHSFMSVTSLKIVVDDDFSIDQLNKWLDFFPECHFLSLISKKKRLPILLDVQQRLFSPSNRIREFSFKNFYINDDGASFLANFISSCTLLSFSKCVFEGNAFTRLSSNKLMSLTQLTLNDCQKISSCFSSLRENLTTRDLYEFVENCTDFEILKLDNINIDLGEICFDSTPHIDVECLHASLDHIDDKVLLRLMKMFPSITVLHLTGNFGAKSDFYFIPPNSLMSLESLYLDCDSLSKRQLQVFCRAAPLIDMESIIEQEVKIEDVEDDADSLYVDADTTSCDNEKLYAERYFWSLSQNGMPIDAGYYRLKIIDRVLVSDAPISLEQAFLLEPSPLINDHQLIEIDRIEQEADLRVQFHHHIENGYDLIRGQYIISSEDQWVSLPSLNSNETLIGYCFADDVIEESDDSIQFSYSLDKRLYYVKTTSAKKLIFYLLISPPNIPLDLDFSISDMIEHLRSFNPIDFKPEKTMSSIDFFDFFMKNKTGSCRHRVVIFKLWMAECFPHMSTRIVFNDIHAFVEIFHQNQWFSIDLGGYPAEVTYLNESDPSSFKAESSPIKADDAQDNRLVYLTNLMMESLSNKGAITMSTFIDELVKKSNKVLLECDTETQLSSLQYGLQVLAKIKNIPFYYVHRPAELNNQQRFLQIDESFVGHFTQDYQSELCQFLKIGKGLLIINYEHFTPEQYVQFNSILDDVRRIQGLSISPDVSIIGLRNKIYTKSSSKKIFYPGSDFYSRFDHVKFYAFEDYIDYEFQFGEAKPDAYQINLYESDDWESILIGQWLPSKTGWTFTPGALIQACLDGIESIHIQNGPWHLESFCHFWRQARVDGYFSCVNFKFDLQAISFSQSQGYFNTQVPLSNESTTRHVFCSYTYGLFFQNFAVEEGMLIRLPGLIEQTEKVLSILITESISKAKWAKFIDQVHEKNIALNIAVAPNVYCDFLENPMPVERLELRNTQLIYTNDTDAFLSTLTDKIIIDISECHASDLIDTIQIQFQDEGDPFIFSTREGFLRKCLDQGKSVVLKGDFSSNLVNGLLPFLLEDHAQLTLVFDKKEALDFFHLIDSPVDKMKLLQKKLSLEILPDFIKLYEPYAKSLARYQYWERTKDLNTDNNWQGLLELHATHKLSESGSLGEIISIRRETLERVLITQPYVFISGLSGVGKTTFIQKNWLKTGEQLFIGNEKILDWLSATSQEKIFLFLDEANLTLTEWSLFEGLFLEKPAIFYDGRYYPLSEKHKVIFAGNPLNYGGERQFAKLFARHGNAIVFRPLSRESIENNILAPIITDNPWSIRQISSIYKELCMHSTSEILISPRELKMLALLAEMNYATMRCRMLNLFYSNLFLILESSLPQEKKEFIIKKMDIKQPYLSDFFIDNEHDWGETHRQGLFMADQLLQLHLYRKNNKLLNDEQQYGGLSGLILEGEPGLGKTEIVKTILRKNNIEAVCISVSTSLVDKQVMLHDAFNQGKVVWIDELNSSPLLEKELNAYLSGHDLQGQRPLKPGFLLIATQNPPNMSGRRELSPALLRRMILLRIAHYTTREMITILNRNGISHDDSERLVHIYNQQKQYQALTFRDLLRCSETVLRAPDLRENKKRARDHLFFSSTIPETKKIKLEQESDGEQNDMDTDVDMLDVWDFLANSTLP